MRAVEIVFMVSECTQHRAKARYEENETTLFNTFSSRQSRVALSSSFFTRAAWRHLECCGCSNSPLLEPKKLPQKSSVTLSQSLHLVLANSTVTKLILAESILTAQKELYWRVRRFLVQSYVLPLFC